ncbi:MAG: RagB/SusD family nutrient uptake outer membrane protein [Chitinophagaceae bacterium]|nr:RagB/SusD family nutrient uptake outer membrane protein [Chitinophagaceae bacterium]
MKKNIFYLLIAVCIIQTACNKTEFLDQKPNSSIIIPTTLNDMRLLLDYTQVFTFSPGLGEMAADDYYLLPVNWQALPAIERSSYVWDADLYSNQQSISDWSVLYQQILYCNIVLEQLEKITPVSTELAEWRDIKGSALFARAFALSGLVQHFAVAFDSTTMGTALGVPIRLTTNVKAYSERSTVQACYDQIFVDLQNAVLLLSPAVPPIAKNRPSRPAAFALLARTALFTEQYSKAKLYADSCLQLYSTLIDYNTVSTSAVAPFDRSPQESLYYSQPTGTYTVLSTASTTTFVDTILYNQYAGNDLRRAIFFRTISGNNMGFKRGYSGTTSPFTGLATNEVYLIRAEALARLGQATAAMTDLNALLRNRWRTGTFVPLTALNAADALNKILIERRKELVWRGLRWLDLKRYNKQGQNITLTRVLGTDRFTLSPTSNKYVFAIPQDEISLSNIIQNPR